YAAGGTSLRELTGATLSLPLYPWLDVAPDGRAIYSGPDPALRALNPSGTGAWPTFAQQRDSINRASAGHATSHTGTVLSAGGGICGTCYQVGYLAKNAEIFSPPYLFQADGSPAPRPVIDAAPASTGYGAPMQIATANLASISKVALVKLGAVTHSDNM